MSELREAAQEFLDAWTRGGVDLSPLLRARDRLKAALAAQHE